MRLAVALVAGQVALCAVIGWVTFGPSDPPPKASGAQTLTGPIVFPTPTLPPLLVPPAPPRASVSKESPRPARSSKSPSSRPTSKPAEDKPKPVMAVDETAVPPEPPKGPDLAATLPPSPIDEVQSPVVVGRPCDPKGAKGRTRDDVELRCAVDDDGDLVWQIN